MGHLVFEINVTAVSYLISLSFYLKYFYNSFCHYNLKIVYWVDFFVGTLFLTLFYFYTERQSSNINDENALKVQNLFKECITTCFVLFVVISACKHLDENQFLPWFDDQ